MGIILTSEDVGSFKDKLRRIEHLIYYTPELSCNQEATECLEYVEYMLQFIYDNEQQLERDL